MGRHIWQSHGGSRYYKHESDELLKSEVVRSCCKGIRVVQPLHL